MTSLFEGPPTTAHRSNAAVVLTALCIVAVGAAVLFNRKTGACGTGHYLFFQLLGGMVVSLFEALVPRGYDAAIAKLLAYFFNVAVFALLVYVWYRKASEARYVIGLLGITAAYLLSHFFLLPTVDCP